MILAGSSPKRPLCCWTEKDGVDLWSPVANDGPSAISIRLHMLMKVLCLLRRVPRPMVLPVPVPVPVPVLVRLPFLGGLVVEKYWQKQISVK